MTGGVEPARGGGNALKGRADIVELLLDVDRYKAL